MHQWLIITMVSFLLVVACGEETKIEESPFVTGDPGGSSYTDEASAGIGTLDISDGCVRMVLDNEESILLIWPEPTSWNATTQTIEYVGLGGERMQLGNGDRIRPGGSVSFRGPQYARPPSPACRGIESFTVGSLVVVTD
jgi:hypothetical protein